jgi:phage-related protein
MDTLAGTYDEASDAFYRNNDALVQSRSAQQQVQDAMAQIGGAVSQVKTALLTEFAPALAAVAPQIANFISGIDVSSLVNGFSQFVGFFVNNGPTIISAVAGIGAAFATWKVTSLISGIVSSLTSLFVPATVAATTAQQGLNVAMKANPIGAIITLVVSLVTAIVTLWTTNEGFRDAVGAIWEAIKGFFLSAKDAIVAAWSTVKDFFSGVWEGIKGAFSAVKEFFSERFQQARQASEAAWDGISSFFSSVWEGIKSVFSAVRDFFSEKFQSAKEAAQSAWDGITNFFSGVWEDIKGVFSNAFNAFLDIGSAIVNGIKNGISRGWSALTGWVSDKAKSLLNAAKSALGINSPSRAFRDVVGMMIPAGIAVGVDKGMPSALDAMSNMANRLLEAGSVEVPVPAIRDVKALDTARVSFSDSGIGRSSAGIINGISSAVQNSGQNGPITLNLVLPDGTKLAKYLFDPLTKYAKANGTPILNPK